MDVCMEKYKLLYVEDDKIARTLLVRITTHITNLEVFEAVNAEEGLKKYIQFHPDIVITDMVMPDHNGVWLSEEIRKINNSVVIVIMSAYFNESDTIKSGIIMIPKPIDFEYLQSILINCIEHVRLQREFNKLAKVIINGGLP